MSKHLTLIGLVLLAGILSSGCFEDDDDGGTGGNSALHGVWMMTEIEAGDTLMQSSTELLANGTMNQIYADFVLEQCAGFDGGWSASEDSITITADYGSGNESSTSAYELNGTTLTVTEEDGTTLVLNKVNTLPSCDDYGFGTIEEWTGSFGAVVDGTPIDFGNAVYVEIEDDMLGFGGFNGVRNLAFVLDPGSAGTYTEANGMATYMPDFNDFMNAYVSSGMTLQLTTSTANHIAGTFTFEAANISAPAETVTVSGQFDLFRP